MLHLNKLYQTTAMSLGIFTVAMATPIASYAAEEEVLDEVIVTGSRIVRKDLTSTSPVTVLNSSEVTFTGTTRIEDLITSLPQAFAAQNSTVANGASGTATVDLRGLGSTRTLVLINGRRTTSGDPFSPAADLNFIPAQLVKRVDVLTGGASSVYGSDAVAGVVNFVLDTDFTGLKMNAQYSFYQHNNRNEEMQAINAAKGFEYPTGNIIDGQTLNLSLAAGSSFDDDRGHASIYVTYRDIGSITKANRDYTNCTVNTGSDGPVCGGSSTTPRGRFISFDSDFGNAQDLVLDWESGGTTFRDRTGEVFNYGPFNHLQRPDTTWSAGAFLTYEVSDKLTGYGEVMFMDNYTRAQIAPTGNFGRTSTINCDNPMLSAQQFDLICTQQGYGPTDTANLTILRRNIEGGPRTNIIRHTNYRFVAGLKGNLDDTWSYDVYGMHAANIASESYINDMNVDRIKDALDIITDPETGQAVCRSGNDGCVPWNIFQQGGVTQEAVDYMTTVAIMNGSTTTNIASASVSGDLGDYGLNFPWAEDGVQIAVGMEHRKEKMNATPDEVYSKGLRAGSGGRTPPVDGNFDVTEFFGEALIPLVQNAEFAQDLSLELAYRYSEYNRFGGASTYKIATSWQPIEDIRFRVGYNRAVRAPNLLDLFRPQGFGLGGNDDICANDPTTGLPQATAAECANTGVSASQYGNIIANPANQYNTLGGGNPDLSPEVADTFTVGVVITPAALPGFSATVDYYNIKISGAIGNLDADDIIQTCANTGDELLCGLINRDSAGTLWLTNDGYTETTNQNIGKLGAEGVDVNVNYQFPVADAGEVQVALVGTYILGDTFSNPLTDYDCAGYFGAQCDQPNAKWRHKLRVSWETNFDTTISVNWRYIGSSQIDDASPDSDLGNPSAMAKWETNGIAKLAGRSFYDLAIVHTINDQFKATLGVNNILDSEPPIAPSISSTGFVGSYDTLGRYVYMGLKATY